MMLRKLLVVACIVGVAAVASPAMAGCPGCDKVVKAGEGSCCGKSMAFGVKLASAKLYEALTGIAVDESATKCGGCKSAAKSSGSCCGKSFANGKSYTSPVAHILAKGKPVTAEKAAKCKGCKEAYTSNGFCKDCKGGIVAHRYYSGEDNYKAALVAHETLAKAAGAKCQACAIAMVKNAKCEQCNVSFKDGKPIKG